MFPRWLSLMFVAVMFYMIYAASQSHPTAEPTGTVIVPPINEQTYPALAEATDIEAWKRKLNPDYAASMNCSLDKPAREAALTMKMVEDKPGMGAGARCGDTITIQLTVWGTGGGTVFDGEVTLALGAREVASGLDAGLPGMAPGGVRTLLLPPATLVRSKASKAPAAVLKALPPGKLAVVTVKRLQ